jgi:cbb3-type cytochrome oxidase subunit 3
MPGTSALAGLTLIEVALIIFVVVFVGIVIWLVLARRGRFDDAARIPLDDDVVTPRSNDVPSPKQ